MTLNAKALFVFLFILMVSATVALSHSWYDYDCCHERDCAPVKDVKYMDDGRIIVLLPLGGQNYTVTFPKDFPKSKIRSSKDERVHACAFVMTTPPNPLCLYLPAGA